MKIRSLFYTLRQGVRNIFRNKWFSLASIATIAACLFLFGLFYAIVSNFQHMVKTAQEGVSVTVFFKEGTTEERIGQIGKLIEARTEEVSKVIYNSAEDAWKEFSEQMNFGEYAQGFPDNPLANSSNYEIYLTDVAKQGQLVEYLESIPEIRRINRSEVAANTLSGANLLIAYVSVGIVVILLAVSVFLISNTVTIGISVRQEEINIMKYIGATDFFVRAPFVIEGMLIGLVGAGIPLGIIYALYNKVINYALEEFPTLTSLLNFLPVDTVFSFLTPVCLCVGVGIGFLGSFVTVRKHLRV
ncbi:MAG: ABC transporter permease [Lachnospiraceae bacterium]|nr:ABC transporter permease [Lachnospiraceae bacterium]